MTAAQELKIKFLLGFITIWIKILMNKAIIIDKTKCIHCGLCLKDCVAECLEFDKNKFPKYKEGGKENCFACQHCLVICPVGALSFGNRKVKRKY